MLYHLRLLPVLALLLTSTGCTLLGVGAAKLMPPAKIRAAYKGMENQSIGVMIWADRGMRIDYPGMQLDAATSIQNKLIAAQKEKSKELKGATFPVKAASIVRYQKDYPQIETLQLIDVAPKLGVSRLIYVEIDEFATRPVPSVDLFRGSMTGTIKLIEIGPDKKAKVAFEESGVHIVFPKKSPEDGIPSSDDYRIYLGTLDAFTTEVVHRFVEYEEEE